MTEMPLENRRQLWISFSKHFMVGGGVERGLAQVVYQGIFLLIYHVALESQVRRAYSIKDS